MRLRPYCDDDLESLIALFETAVLAIDEACYSAAQRNAWAYRMKREAWTCYLQKQRISVAQVDGRMAGFCATGMTHDHIELLYVHPVFQGKGIGGEMLRHLLCHAQAKGVQEITAKASLLSLTVFLRYGFRDEGRAYTRRNGVSIPYHRVRKSFS